MDVFELKLFFEEVFLRYLIDEEFFLIYEYMFRVWVDVLYYEEGDMIV